MGGAMNWLYHNRAIFPDCYPHEEPQVQTVPWKEFPHAQMARWTTDFDCGHKTQWWYCIKDSAFDLAALNAKRRYEINKGNRNFETRLIDPAQHRDELYAVYENSLLGYDPGDRPQVSKKQFDAKIDNWNSIPEARIFGVFDRESGALCGYADVYERGRYLPISSMKTRVDCEKRNVNFALVYGILIHYERQLSSTLTPGGLLPVRRPAQHPAPDKLSGVFSQILWIPLCLLHPACGVPRADEAGGQAFISVPPHAGRGERLPYQDDCKCSAPGRTGEILSKVSRVSFICGKEIALGFYARWVKRPLDIFCALLALIVLSPVIAVTAVLVRVKLGSPVIFRQQRPGRDERIFTMYKFRTMTDQRDEAGELLPDSVRLTSFGKLLRSTSLDELPELVNILKGDMSVVGPRPLLVRDMVFMTPEQRTRHQVRQGLTGLAQANGRNAASWEEKLNLDVQYIQNITFWGDVKIILATVGKVIKREGVAAEGMETAEDLGDYLLRTRQIDDRAYQQHMLESRELQEA